MFKLRISTEGCSSFTIECEGSKTVKDLKDDIHRQLNIPPNLQELDGFPIGVVSDDDVCVFCMLCRCSALCIKNTKCIDDLTADDSVVHFMSVECHNM